MQKSIETKKEIIPDEPKHKGRRKKRETACVDKRRYFMNCPYCGSENLISFQLYSCDKCGKEEYDINAKIWWGFKEPICDCLKNEFRGYRVSISHDFGTTVCNDCSAYQGPICPSCKVRGCWWKLNEGKKCKRCGYTEQ